MENWKPIEGYEGLYEVSTAGAVRNLKRNGYTLKALTVTHGYKAVALHKEGKRKMMLIHRLVAAAFIPNPENKPQVNHINGIKTDNRAENLEWATSQENLQHAMETGLKPKYPTKLKRSPESHPIRTADLWRSCLKDIREGEGLTQEELAEACCVQLDTIKRLESNGMYFRSVGLNTACKLSFALGVSIEALFDYDVAEAIKKEKAWHKK